MSGLLGQALPLLPELLLTATALGLLLVARCWSRPAVVGELTLAAFGGALVSLLALGGPAAPAQALCQGMLVRTPLTAFFQVGVLGVMLLITLLLLGYAPLARMPWAECFSLLLLSTVGLLLLIGAQSVVMIYVGLELVSLTSYLLTGFLRQEATSAEAGLKYFLYGTLATAMMLYGIGWLYGATGTLDLPTLTAQLLGGSHPHHPMILVGILLLTVGLGFKVGLVPFHHWAPDAYEGAPTPIAAFISAGPKLAGFAVLLRLFWLAFRGVTAEWAPVLEVLAILTMTLGNVAALWQTNVKRLLAYSSIAQAGYIVIGVVAASGTGAIAVGYYVVAYVLMNVAAFACVIAVSNATGRDDISAYAGLAQTQPVLAAAFAIALLSLAGIPPTAGFLAKVGIFVAALQSGRLLLAIAAAINSVIAVAYYAVLLKQMYLKAPAPDARAAATPWPLAVALGASLAGLLLFGLWPAPLWSWLSAALPVTL